MELSDYLRVLRERWITVAFVALGAVSAALAGALLTTPVYTASTLAFVSTQGSGDATDLLQGSNFTQQRVRSYARIATTPRVLDPVIESLGLDVTARELAADVSTSVPPETVLISISARNPDPVEAAEVANAIAASFSDEVARLETPAGDDSSAVQVSVVEQAVVPVVPSAPRPLRSGAIALLLGGLAGFGIAVLRHRLDTGVHGEEELKQVTSAPVLGRIGLDPEARSRPLIVEADPHGVRAEAFRQLRTNLQFVDVSNHPRSIVVTSSVPAEGKSTTAANLAITMADAGVRVCIVDADLRRPKLADYMGVVADVGLTTVLIGRATLADVTQPWGREGRLHVLASGQAAPNPSELLGSQAMAGLLHELETAFDVVIIDAPPLLPVTDGAILSRLAGGSLLVVGCDRVHRRQVEKALTDLQHVGARLLGVVLNMVPQKGGDAYGYYGYRRAADSDERVERGPDRKPERSMPLAESRRRAAVTEGR